MAVIDAPTRSSRTLDMLRKMLPVSFMATPVIRTELSKDRTTLTVWLPADLPVTDCFIDTSTRMLDHASAVFMLDLMLLSHVATMPFDSVEVAISRRITIKLNEPMLNQQRNEIENGIQWLLFGSDGIQTSVQRTDHRNCSDCTF